MGVYGYTMNQEAEDMLACELPKLLTNARKSQEREKSPRNPVVDAHYAKKAHSARELAAAEAFLSDTTSPFARIVPARAVSGETRRRRL